MVIEWIFYLFAHPVLALGAPRLNVRGIQGAHESQGRNIRSARKVKLPFLPVLQGIFE